MRASVILGLVLLVLGVASLFVSIPQRERHGVSVGDASIGVETRTSRKVAPVVSAVMIISGAALVIVGRKRN
jgi:hypothetical protein